MNTLKHITTNALMYVCLSFGITAPVLAKSETLRIGNLLSIGAPDIDYEFFIETNRAQGLDEPDEAQRDATGLEAGFGLDIEQILGSRTEANMKMEFNFDWFSQPDIQNANQSATLTVRELFIQHDYKALPFRGRFGRQSLDDEMGWFIDEDLDGVRFSYKHKIYPLDLSVTRQDWFRVDNTDREDRIYNLLGAWRFKSNKNSVLTPYVLHRSVGAFNGEPAAETTWFGIQSVGRLNNSFRYWFNSGVRSGKEEKNSGTETLGGLGIDSGLTWVLDHRFKPSVTIGLAHGSGDSSSRDLNDRSFRQSGLHSNKFKFNGLTRFKYLGEVLDPELANIEILTLGAGARLNKRWSVDLVYHNYRQAVAQDRLRGTDFESEPEGQSKQLGHGADLIVGYKHSNSLSLSAVGGMFDPGAAFDASTDDAWILNLEVEYEF